MKSQFLAGDIVRNKFGDERIIFLVNYEHYFYLERHANESKLFYNPTRSTVTYAVMHQKWHKVGEYKQMNKLLSIVALISQKYTEAFNFAETQLATLSNYETSKPTEKVPS